jgi:gluconolactonase
MDQSAALTHPCLSRGWTPVRRRSSNCAFGGPDRRTLFITEAESASILTVDLPVAGMPLFGG